MMNTAVGSLGVGSFAHGSSKRSFDVRNEKEVIGLLRLVHLHTLDPEIKNHLRDLIFTYRHTMNLDDAKLVQQSFAPLGIEIIFSDHTDVHAAPSTSFAKGFSRPMPRFVPLAINAKSVVPPAPVAPKNASEATLHAAPVPAEDLSAALPPTPVPESSVQKEVPPVAFATAQSGAPASLRIKEIKRLVNEKIGNPVNLMDTHTEIGREYMNALLDAMKKTNGAAAGELEAAMARLEDAFTQVQGIISDDTHAEAPALKETTPTPSRTETPVQQTQAPVEKMVSVPSYQDIPAPQSAPLSASGEVNAVPIRLVSLKENIAERTPVPAEARPDSEQSEPAKLQQESPAAIHSVAKEKQLQELLRVNKQREVQSKIQAEEVAHTSSDPLQSPEVIAGLNQLLSEWSLFKNSGLFGTGPNGKDHPLYKKLESLTMAAVIAGRFEGATPAIKQSITDYMNGWRYEEGIVHEHAETFEHYLRKVVAHILSRKKFG